MRTVNWPVARHHEHHEPQQHWQGILWTRHDKEADAVDKVDTLILKLCTNVNNLIRVK